MVKRKKEKVVVKNLGPIKQADVEFGDLTVLVGPQATGKSVFLQTLKLLKDRNHIHATFRNHNVAFNGKSEAFLDGYYGNGMSSIWRSDSALESSGKPVSLPEMARPSKAKAAHERLFFIPAQRVVSLRGGTTQNFGQFDFGDPYTLRQFADTVHDLVQNEFGARGELFPQSNRLNETLRKPINEHLFGGGKLAVDLADYTKRLVLNVPGAGKGLPYLAWSAGQREFTPLLLGLYWLCPAGSTSRREGIEWVVIEELEMGLHPQAIATVLLLVMELLRREYKVVISTHSQVVLDMVWALQVFKKYGGAEYDVRSLFAMNATKNAKTLGEVALQKEYRVYFFQRDGVVVDISCLDPGAESMAEAEWGGLSGFSSRAGEVVAAVVNRKELVASHKRKKKPKESRGT